MRSSLSILLWAAVGCQGAGLKVAAPSDSADTDTDTDPGPADSVPGPTDSDDSAGPAPQARVVITELMYHPVLGDFYADRHEFIELHNAGDAAAELAGWSFDKGVTYTFGDRVLEPGQTLLVAVDAAALLEAYPSLSAEQVVGDWQGALANGGERVRLLDAAGETVDELTYEDDAPWPLGADALGASESWLSDEDLPLEDHRHLGRSLQRVSLSAASDDPGNWVASPLDGMDPGTVTATPDGPPLSVVTAWSWGTDGPLTPDTDATLSITTNQALGDPRLQWFVDDVASTDEPTTTVALTEVAPNQYTATLPAQVDQTILRFRILGDQGRGDGVASPRSGDPMDWHGAFVGHPIEGETRPYRIYIDPRQWAAMWDSITAGRVLGCDVNPGWEARFPAVFVHEGAVHDVQVRYQGSRWNRTNGPDMTWPGEAPGSPSPLKTLSWSVKFPRYAALGERTRISLNKLTQSCPGTSTVVGFQLFKAVGLPVPETRYVRLFINGTYYHYMLELESPGEDMLERWLDEGTTTEEPGVPHLFKSGGCYCDEGPYGWGDERPLGESCEWSADARYAATYERKSWDWGDHSELRQLIEGLDAARGGSVEDLRSFLDASFDVDLVLAYLSVMNWAVPFDDMFQNHYLAQRRSDGKWFLAPWDLDYNFGGWKGAGASIYIGEEGNIDNRSGWWNRIKDAFLKAYRPEFDAKLAELNQTVLHPDRVVPMIDANEASWNLSEAAAAPAGPQCDFTAKAEAYRSFSRDRHSVVSGIVGD